MAISGLYPAFPGLGDPPQPPGRLDHCRPGLGTPNRHPRRHGAHDLSHPQVPQQGRLQLKSHPSPRSPTRPGKPKRVRGHTSPGWPSLTWSLPPRPANIRTACFSSPSTTWSSTTSCGPSSSLPLLPYNQSLNGPQLLYPLTIPRRLHQGQLP